MIRVTVLYPNTEGAKFDHEYYAGSHMDLVKSRIGAALVESAADKGLGSAEPGAPPPFVAAGHLVFNSLADFQGAFGAHAGELMADIPNITNVEPVIQISEIA